MKDITITQYRKAPADIKKIYQAWMMDMSVSSGVLEVLIHKYPKYFDDEVEQLKRYSHIPEDIKDRFNQIYEDAEQQIIDQSADPEEAKSKVRIMKKSLTRSHFGQYGISERSFLIKIKIYEPSV